MVLQDGERPAAGESPAFFDGGKQLNKIVSAFLALVLVVSLALLGATGSPATAQTTSQTPITSTQTLSDGRQYTFHRIAETQNQPMPLVVMLHGYAQTSDSARTYTNLEAYSDAQGFNVIFGKGTAGKWNAGDCCGGATTDDVNYLRNVVDDIASKTLVDRNRVYVWGFSNGGMMAFRAACEAPEYFAAAGVMGGTLTSPCTTHDVDVRHVHGNTDTTVPFRGGYNSSLNVTFRDNLRVTDALTAGSTWTPTLLANCPHTWASLTNTCGYSATGTLWQWSKDKVK